MGLTVARGMSRERSRELDRESSERRRSETEVDIMEYECGRGCGMRMIVGGKGDEREGKG